jgi:hypothetical protein
MELGGCPDYFDTVPWDLVVRAVEAVTDCRWVLLYAERERSRARSARRLGPTEGQGAGALRYLSIPIESDPTVHLPDDHDLFAIEADDALESAIVGKNHEWETCSLRLQPRLKLGNRGEREDRSRHDLNFVSVTAGAPLPSSQPQPRSRPMSPIHQCLPAQVAVRETRRS